MPRLRRGRRSLDAGRRTAQGLVRGPGRAGRGSAGGAAVGRGGCGGACRHIVLDELSAGVVERLDPATAAYVNASGLAKASPMGMGLYRIEPVGTVGSVRTPTVQLEVRPKGQARAEPAPVPARLRGGPGLPGRFRGRGGAHRPVERPGRIPGAAGGPGPEPRGAAGVPDGGGIPPDRQGPDPDLGPDLPPARHAGPAGGLLRRVHRGHRGEPDSARRAGTDVPGAAACGRRS